MTDPNRMFRIDDDSTVSHDAMGNPASLWCAVIHQALTDATRPVSLRNQSSAYKNLSNDQDQARAWLVTPSPSLRMVCDWSGLEMSCVIAKARKLEADGWPRVRV